MIDNFNYAMNLTFANEGGLSNQTQDHGGITNYGVTVGFLSSLGKDIYDIDGDGNPNELVGDLNSDGKVDSSDIKLLTKEEVFNIYKDYIWNKMNLDLLTSKFISAQTFDIGVNSGIRMGVKLLQRTAGVLQDGILGHQTVSVVNLAPEINLNNSLVRVRIAFYQAIVDHDPTQEKFLKGWIARANRYNLSQ